MIIDINPFSFLYEAPKYPFARTWRTSITQKMMDVQHVFTGKFSYQSSQLNISSLEVFESESLRWFWNENHWQNLLMDGRLGVFDYLTCGIPYFVSDCLAKLLLSIQCLKKTHQSSISFGLLIIIDIVQRFLRVFFILWNCLVHGIARTLVGAIGLFFFGLLIGLPIAYFAEWYAKPIKERALQLQGVSGVDDRINKNDTLTLNEFLLKEKTAEISSILIDIEHYQCRIYKNDTRCYLKINYPEARHSFYAEIHGDNIVYLEHLLALNFAQVVDVFANNESTVSPIIAGTASHTRLFRSSKSLENENALREEKSVASHL